MSASSETTRTVRWKEGREGKKRKKKNLYEPQKYDTINNRQKTQNNRLEVGQSVKDSLLDMGNTELSALRAVIKVLQEALSSLAAFCLWRLKKSGIQSHG